MGLFNFQKLKRTNTKYEMIETLFDDLNDYMRFFLKLNEARKATTDFSCVAILKKEDDKYLYTIEWKDGHWLAEYVRPFRPTEKNLALFHAGCAEMARLLRMYIETGDLEQLPKKPAFGILSCESPDELAQPPHEPEQPAIDHKYFPLVQDARLVKRYDVGTHEIILLTDVRCAGLVRCSHVLVVFNKGEQEPSYVVAAEVNNVGSSGDGSHFLGCYPGTGHVNLGCSDDWGDLSLFEKKACELVNKELGISIA